MFVVCWLPKIVNFASEGCPWGTSGGAEVHHLPWLVCPFCKKRLPVLIASIGTNPLRLCRLSGSAQHCYITHFTMETSSSLPTVLHRVRSVRELGDCGHHNCSLWKRVFFFFFLVISAEYFQWVQIATMELNKNVWKAAKISNGVSNVWP